MPRYAAEAVAEAVMKKSPGGSTFPYYYKGGEIHALKYGSLSDNAEKLIALMDAEEAFIKGMPNRRLRVWVDFYESSISERILDRFTEQIGSLGEQIVKLAIVGLSGRDRHRMKRALKKGELSVPCGFYADPEEAKTWLVDVSV